MPPQLHRTPCPAVPRLARRVLYKLEELVRPYVHKILVVIEPLLIDEDYYARCGGRALRCGGHVWGG